MTADVLPLRDDLRSYAKEFARMILDEVRAVLANETTKEFYSTEELAEALGKKPFTIRENWCNRGKIECDKDASGKWRIPGSEYRRLVNGGELN